jgi:hypothetical protein
MLVAGVFTDSRLGAWRQTYLQSGMVRFGGIFVHERSCMMIIMYSCRLGKIQVKGKRKKELHHLTVTRIFVRAVRIHGSSVVIITNIIVLVARKELII